MCLETRRFNLNDEFCVLLSELYQTLTDNMDTASELQALIVLAESFACPEDVSHGRQVIDMKQRVHSIKPTNEPK